MRLIRATFCNDTPHDDDDDDDTDDDDDDDDDNDDDDVFIHPSVPRSYIQPSRVQKGKATW